MKVLITGGAGFIGSNLVHYLVANRPSWQITVLDLLTYAGNLENILGIIDSQMISFIKGDIADPETVGEVFKKNGSFDLVLHLAAESHVDRSLYAASSFVTTNVVGTQNLINAALETKIPRFIHVSTDEVYGSMGPNQRADENYNIIPSSPYSASKAASDLMVLAACQSLGLPAVVTRCTNNYGPYQFPEKFIPLFIIRAMKDEDLPLYGDGEQMRSWIHVNDHCEALLRLAEHQEADQVIGKVFNIGGPLESELPNIVVAKEILKRLKKPESLIKHVTDRPAHDRKYAVTSAALSNLTQWQPKVMFADGLLETVNWYQENQKWWQSVMSGEYQSFFQQHYGDR
jgi:dTDP-glucose 4,6-dehydratase